MIHKLSTCLQEGIESQSHRKQSNQPLKTSKPRVCGTSGAHTHETPNERRRFNLRCPHQHTHTHTKTSDGRRTASSHFPPPLMKRENELTFSRPPVLWNATVQSELNATDCRLRNRRRAIPWPKDF